MDLPKINNVKLFFLFFIKKKQFYAKIPSAFSKRDFVRNRLYAVFDTFPTISMA